jgi:hypothetical protein
MDSLGFPLPDRECSAFCKDRKGPRLETLKPLKALELAAVSSSLLLAFPLQNMSHRETQTDETGRCLSCQKMKDLFCTNHSTAGRKRSRQATQMLKGEETESLLFVTIEPSILIQHKLRIRHVLMWPAWVFSCLTTNVSFCANRSTAERKGSKLDTLSRTSGNRLVHEERKPTSCSLSKKAFRQSATTSARSSCSHVTGPVIPCLTIKDSLSANPSTADRKRPRPQITRT